MGKTKIEWVIRPHEGAGPLDFGMSEAEVAAILGPPDFVKSGADDQGTITTEYRDSGDGSHCVVMYGKNGVRELDFEKHAKSLSLDDRKLFAGKRGDLIEALIESTDTVFEDFEGYVFPDLGLNMSNAQNLEKIRISVCLSRGHLIA